MKYPSPPGVFDIVPESPQELWRTSSTWDYVEGVFCEMAVLYGFQEIRTPVIERTELFIRSVGEASDIVSKEMYTFDDKGGRSLFCALKAQRRSCVRISKGRCRT